MVLEHHERINGSGYPNRLTGEKLLIESRILAVADVVEAITFYRPYRLPYGIETDFQFRRIIPTKTLLMRKKGQILATYSMLGRLTSKFTRSSNYESRKVSSNTIEITVTPREGVQEKPYRCENRWGMFQAIFDLFVFKLSRTDHPECVFKGGQVCRYIFSWESPPSAVWKRIRNLTAVLLLSAGALLIPIFPWDTMVVISILSVFFLLTYVKDFLEKKELTSTINNFRKSAEEQIDQIDINWRSGPMPQKQN